MASDPEADIQRLWHDQLREERTMAIGDIHARAGRFEKKTRNWNSVAGVAIILAGLGNAWQVVFANQVMLDRVGDLLSIAALVYVAYRFRGYGRLSSMPAGLGLTTSVDFYRTQLARQRDLTSGGWRYLLLFVPGVSLSLFGRALDRSMNQNIAVAAAGVALFLGVAWLHARTARRLQAEIAALSS
jgi:hypothetical protein